MQAFICTACGTQYPPSTTPPSACIICEEERQFVPLGGQSWATLQGLSATRFNGWRQHEPGILGMIFAVGGLTSLAGAWVASRAWVLRQLGPAMPASLFIRAAGMLCMPLAASVSPLGVLFLVANQLITDPAWMFYEIHETSLRQRLTSDEFLGRVNATMRFAGFGAALAGTGLAAAKLFAAGLGILLHLKRVHLIVAFLTAFYIAVAIVPWTLLFLSL